MTNRQWALLLERTSLLDRIGGEPPTAGCLAASPAVASDLADSGACSPPTICGPIPAASIDPPLRDAAGLPLSVRA